MGGKTIVEVGNLSIGGSIETAEIERGLLRVETGLKDVDTVGSSVNSDFERMNVKGKKLAGVFSGLAVAGATAMISIAKDTPAVAGAMAKIDISSMKLKRTVGDIMSPAFDKGAESFSKFASLIESNKDKISNALADSMETTENRLDVISAIYDKISGFVSNFKESSVGQTIFGSEETETEDKTIAGQMIEKVKSFNPLSIMTGTAFLDFFSTNDEGNLEVTMFNSILNKLISNQNKKTSRNSSELDGVDFV